MPAFDALAFLVRFASTPTVPFREERVRREVAAFAKRYRSIEPTTDAHGNTLLIRRGRRGDALPRLVFVAHLDHPGFVVAKRLDAKTVRCDFRGGVLASFVDGCRVRFFDGDREVVGTVIATTGDAGRCATADVRVRGDVPVGAIGMFDVGVGRLVGKRFHCRACDDLAGAAAALCTLVDLARRPADCDVGVLLTRGEEEGFIGAIASVIEPTLLRPTDRMISIETSAEQPVARQGEGVVLRVGDRTSVFHSAFGRFLFDAATTLATDDETFKFQRALMPGGTCEGTVFDAWGYTTAAVCVALGNYHNMDRAKHRIAAEHVHVDDWRNMVRLFVHVARTVHAFDGTHEALQARLKTRYETWCGRLLEGVTP